MDININTVMQDLLAAASEIAAEIRKCADELWHISADIQEIKDKMVKDD